MTHITIKNFKFNKGFEKIISDLKNNITNLETFIIPKVTKPLFKVRN